MSLWVVVGGQYGSEGKGKVSAFITKQENIDICVRCGGPNSGHSFVDEHGRTIVLRQLPTGYVRSKTRLLIPAGALIDLDVLKNEIEALHIAPERIGIDPNCFVIEASSPWRNPFFLSDGSDNGDSGSFEMDEAAEAKNKGLCYRCTSGSA